jgi:myosin-5
MSLTKGTLIWLPCGEGKVWKGVEVTADLSPSDKTLAYTETDGDDGCQKTIATDKLVYHLRNPDILIGQNDLTSLSYLHEPAVLYNLSYRFGLNTIYTYCGIVLVAINPYDELDIYNRETILAYRSVGASGGNVKQMDPHIFAVAEEAYTKLER